MSRRDTRLRDEPLLGIESDDGPAVVPLQEDEDMIDLSRADTSAAAGRWPQGPTGTRLLYRAIGAALIVIDSSCLAAALLLAHVVRFGRAPEYDYLTGVIAAAIIWIAVFHAFGLYAPQNVSAVEQFRRTVAAVAIGIVVVILLTFWFDVYLSRSWMALTLIFALVLELVSRWAVGAFVSLLHDRRSLLQRTLVVGNGENSAELMSTLGEPGSGFLPLGYVDATTPPVGRDEGSTPDHVDRLRHVMRECHPDCVFVASPTIGAEQMLAVMQAARREGGVVRVYTHLTGTLTSRVTVQPVGRHGVALTLRSVPFSRAQRAIKRLFDLSIASLVLLLTFPFLAAIAVAIKVTSEGPVLFRQDRVTEGGREFAIYKFRTMTVGAESQRQSASIDTAVPFFKLKDDPRVTRLGAFLRRLSLDEFPQLFNVIRGDMSLVGPRPLSVEQVTASPGLLDLRHEVRAGLTGWWQINGRSELTPEEAVGLDLFYIENWSLTLDLYILLRTVGVLLRRRGAY